MLIIYPLGYKTCNWFINYIFREFARVFLIGSYIVPNSAIDIHYYGFICSFDVLLSIEEEFEAASIDEDTMIYEVGVQCSVNIILNKVPSRTLNLSDFGGNEHIKKELIKYLITPMKQFVKYFEIFSSEIFNFDFLILIVFNSLGILIYQNFLFSRFWFLKKSFLFFISFFG